MSCSSDTKTRRVKRESCPFTACGRTETTCSRPTQAIQRRRAFEVDQLVACFVVTPSPENATLFVGLYSVDGVASVAEGALDPVFGNDVSGMFPVHVESR